MYSPLRHAGSIFRKREPIHLTFFVTRKCNARCPFCFYVNNNTGISKKAPELSLNEIESVSLSLGKLLWLAFSGGEPYLRKDLVDISKLFYQYNQPYIMLYPTNGLLPEVIRHKTEQILQYCRNSIVAVKLSLDGVGADHDRLRDTPGGFVKTMKAYGMLGELLDEYSNFELGINTVFCSENQDKMDEIINFVRDLKQIKTHTISMVRGNLADPRYKEVDFEKYLRATKKLEQNLKNRTSSIYRFNGARLKAAQDIVQRRLIYQTLISQQRQIPCYAGRLNLVLTETGEAYPCELSSTSLGNVRDYGYDLRRLTRSRHADSTIESIHNDRCYCTHECNFMTNILFNPRSYPSLFKEYIQIRPYHSTRATPSRSLR